MQKNSTEYFDFLLAQGPSTLFHRCPSKSNLLFQQPGRDTRLTSYKKSSGAAWRCHQKGVPPQRTGNKGRECNLPRAPRLPHLKPSAHQQAQPGSPPPPPEGGGSVLERTGGCGQLVWSAQERAHAGAYSQPCTLWAARRPLTFPFDVPVR